MLHDNLQFLNEPAIISGREKAESRKSVSSNWHLMPLPCFWLAHIRMPKEKRRQEMNPYIKSA